MGWGGLDFGRGEGERGGGGRANGGGGGGSWGFGMRHLSREGVGRERGGLFLFPFWAEEVEEGVGRTGAGA